MYIKKLFVENFRNLSWLEFSPAEGVNLIYGANGSGKTSLLEAISYLSLGRSFKTSKYHSLISNGKSGFIISSKIKEDSDKPEITLGISRDRFRDKDLHIKINSNKVSNLSELVDKICVQIMHPQGIELITGLPEVRRRFLDWGVYFSVPDYLKLWAKYRRILAQRNWLLKTNSSEAQIVVWDDLFCSLAEKINYYRIRYLKEYIDIFNDKIAKFLPDLTFEFSFYNGWDSEVDLRSAVSLHLEKDRFLGYTFYGCHRADLRLKASNQTAADFLSRGQLKLLVCAMKLSQGYLFFKQTGRKCIFLIDDLTSELDIHSRNLLLNDLSALSNQVFITNISENIDFPGFNNVSCFDIAGNIKNSA